MTTMEQLSPDQELNSLSNRLEINRRSNNGITVVAYWLMKENVCLIFVHDRATNDASEFVVPNDEVGKWFAHPYAHPDARGKKNE